MPSVRSEESPGQVPDLELLVQERPGSGGRGFDLRLKARDPELDLNYRPVGSITLRAEPGEFFRQQIAEIWKDRPRKAGRETGVTDLLRAKGAYLSETILPRELKSRLSELRGKVRSLLIQSDDPWIPWEILRVPETPGGDAADGPFLCEAFALTRWLSGTGQTLSLPLRRIAVVVPRDSDLPQAEGESEDLLALAQPEARQVERIPARLSSLQEAFRRGEHDGWHFTGHGTHRESAPDLSSIWLEDGEELTPVYLSGREKKLGDKRPLVFLNACSSGKSGMSLTDIGGWAPHFLRANAGACIGALWPIEDGPARAFAQAFYGAFLAGAPIAEAVYAARQAIRSESSAVWLAYTVFAHPLAMCAPPALSELQPRQPAIPAWPAPSAPPVQTPRLRRAWIAVAGIALLLFLVATAGRLAVTGNPTESGDSFTPATELLDDPPRDEPRIEQEQSKEPEQKPPVVPAAAPPSATRSAAAEPEPRIEGNSFKITGSPGSLKSTLAGALREESAQLASIGISGWTLYLDVDPPQISKNREGMESCQLTAHCRATGRGFIDLGTARGLSAQYNRTEACEDAAERLAKEAVHELVSSIRKGAT
ncbi:MAG TPA: CHAT domain-containing protein [Thermoanaerobaculia bacterium]|nr:CHAT domain-containing protein [Thermoanaerobaculia bacterium]